MSITPPQSRRRPPRLILCERIFAESIRHTSTHLHASRKSKFYGDDGHDSRRKMSSRPHAATEFIETGAAAQLMPQHIIAEAGGRVDAPPRPAMAYDGDVSNLPPPAATLFHAAIRGAPLFSASIPKSFPGGLGAVTRDILMRECLLRRYSREGPVERWASCLLIDGDDVDMSVDTSTEMR